MKTKVFLSLLFLSFIVVSCQKEPQPIKVTGITLNASSLSLIEGETADLTATVSPKDADNQTVLWSSSNGSVASVNYGKVTALAPGSTTITAKSDDGGFTASCSVTVISKTIEVASISLSKTELSITEGESETITATVKPDDATDKTVIWTSSDSSIAAVDDGKIIAVHEGSAIINAKAGDKTSTCKVTVKKKIIYVESIAINKSTLNMTEGESETLFASVKPDNATDKSVTWSSSNDTVATVSSSGVVTAKAPGTAIITVKTNDGGKTASCSVSVKAKTISVTGVSLNKTSLPLLVGETEKLTATVSPSNATNKKVTWSSSDSGVATVDSNGNVSAKKVGTAVITVTTEDGGKTANCTVTVKPISVTGVSLNHTSLTMTKGDTQTLVATITPSNATDKSVTWSSNNTSVASVSSSGVVSAKTAGTAKITVMTTDGGLTATCTVTVNDKIIPVSSVSLNKTSVTLTEGDVQTLTETISPSNATDKTVTWSSSNTSVATVSSGVVIAKAAGSATITVRTNDGGKTATCSVKVEAKKVSVTGVVLNKSSLTMTVGDTQTLTATISPSNATDKSVTWNSSNTSVATVSSSGLITAKSAGSATITVSTNDGAKTASCSVTVQAKKVSVTGVSLNKTSLTMTEGEAQTLTATVSPSNATDKTVSWSSSNPSAATVSSSGIVTAKAEGYTLITVTTNDGAKTASCSITVKAKTVPVTGVTLNYTSLSLTEGQATALYATVIPSNATNKSVTWSSNNTSVATVSSNGVVTAKAPGSATITVITNDGGMTATCYVTVKANTVSVSSVSLSPTSLSMVKGWTHTFKAYISPDNAADKTVTWSSSNTSVATVSSSGVVTAQAVGSATITVKTNDGGMTASCDITVLNISGISPGDKAYVGTGVDSPTPEVILSQSDVYTFNVNSTIIAPKLTGTYFWIVIPYGYSLKRANNIIFEGDYIPLEYFLIEPIILNERLYKRYYLHSVIPMYNQHELSFEKDS